MEELLRQILGRLDRMEQQNETRFDSLEKRFDSLEVRFDKLENRVGNLESRFDTLEGRFDALEGRFDNLEGRFDALEGRFDTLEGRFDNLEGQVRENTDLLKAIQHNTEVLNAKVEALTLTTASKDAVARLDAKFEVLNARLFQQEVEIHQLKAIK
ncbi:MAG: hypothetical protein VB133_12640 [Anaeromusa sp.]|uniref:hypothetical protein n=1 Tax=Anaeromusa sp. TaxID=1872520 RepID=UPI002B1F06FA|nr:hypothetical protein [Anaeromusa sp.]MEA4835973.1 hypothetical protein [Anaeromusa sp.]